MIRAGIDVPSTDPGKLGVVVLAAGAGARFTMGAGVRVPKLLAPLEGRPLLEHVLDAVRAIGAARTVVVLGQHAPEIMDSIRWRGEETALNPDPARGLSGSVQVGLQAMMSSGELEAALLVLGDQPRLDPAVVHAILAAADAFIERPFVVPRYADDGAGQATSNPVLIRRSAWSLASTLDGDRGFAPYIRSHPELVHEVSVPGSAPDVDTRQDLVELRRIGPPSREIGPP